MSEAAQTRDGPDPGEDFLADDLNHVRLEQARLLHRRTDLSCLIVEGVIIYFTALILFAGDYGFAAIWFAVTSALVGLVFIYPRLAGRGGITPSNFKPYLRGHQIISAVTGLVWSALAIAYLDPSSILNLFITINMVCSITFGGMLPSAEYRPSFVSLSTGMFIPFSTYWLVTVEGPARLIGIGLLIFYGFGLLVSARAEIQTVETLAAERNRRLADRLRAQNQIVEKTSAEKSRFLAATSHDMSQPLQAQGFFIQAIRRTLDRPEQIELLDKIEAAWRSQQTLLQALVESARLDSGAVRARKSAFTLESVLAGLRTEFDNVARSRQISLSIEDGSVAVHSDPLLTTRILRNLLSNALKFTQGGGAVRLDWVADTSHVVIRVSDNGPGIPTDDRERIFDEYVQLEQSRSGSQLGLGLGLPIVRQLADRLNADFQFESVPGTGTTASISLPLSESAVDDSDATPPMESLDGSPLVVLVEDEAAIREGLEILLTYWGCRVIAAGSGSDALALLSWADAEPALLIVDKRLADGEDGLDVIAGLRSEVLDDIPAILLSGDIFQYEDVADFPEITVLPKPADTDQLRVALVDALKSGAQSSTPTGS